MRRSTPGGAKALNDRVEGETAHIAGERNAELKKGTCGGH